MNLKDYIRVIPDFPQPGIRFKDITTLLKNGPAYQAMINEFVDIYKDKEIDLIIGPEARGFVIAAPLAYALGVGFVPVRKPKKLPHETIEVTYDLEYGKDSLVMHKDAILPGQKVLIADDLLATGGTIAATLELAKQLEAEIVGAAFLIELTYLNGRKKLGDMDITTLVQY
jgi:adenine phosphoribosyltransferase